MDNWSNKPYTEILLAWAFRELYNERSQTRRNSPVRRAPAREHPARLLAQRLRLRRASEG